MGEQNENYDSIDFNKTQLSMLAIKQICQYYKQLDFRRENIRNSLFLFIISTISSLTVIKGNKTMTQLMYACLIGWLVDLDATFSVA